MEDKEIRKQKYEDGISLSLMTKEDAHILFKDFENDLSIYEDKSKYKEYSYNYDEVEKYVKSKINKGYILLSVKYNDDVIGEVRFKGIDNNASEIGIILKNNHYKNKGIGTIVLKKALDYAKANLKLNKIYALILKSNTRSRHVFEKNEFVFWESDDIFDKFIRELK